MFRCPKFTVQSVVKRTGQTAQIGSYSNGSRVNFFLWYNFSILGKLTESSSQNSKSAYEKNGFSSRVESSSFHRNHRNSNQADVSFNPYSRNSNSYERRHYSNKKSSISPPSRHSKESSDKKPVALLSLKFENTPVGLSSNGSSKNYHSGSKYYRSSSSEKHGDNLEI